MRRSARRGLGLLAACILAGLAACASPSTGGAEQAPSTSSPPVAVAPWVDVTAPPVPDLVPLVGQGMTTVNLGFVTAAGGSCRPAWGGTTAIDGAPAALVRRFRAAGGDVRASFGGADGVELARACPTSDALATVYAQVIDALDVRLVDLDVEGAALRDAASVHRRNEALARVAADAEERGRPLRISYTLPAETGGLTPAAVALLRDARAVGLRVDAVDLLAMDYAGATTDVVGATADAVRNARTALAAVWGDTPPALAVTAMIGVSDVPGQVLPLADAKRLTDAVRRGGAAWFGFWSLNRDRPCTETPIGAHPTCSGVSQEAGAFTRAFRAGAG